MNKETKLEILLLLSALESCFFSRQQTIPDYLHDKLAAIVESLSDDILNEKSPD